MKAALILLSLFVMPASTQAQTIIAKAEKNPREEVLGALFPVDAIVRVNVSNNSGTHRLTVTELSALKEQLKQARFAGGLLIKPGHIVLEIKLAGKTVARPGFVYGSTGAIHFEGATDKHGQRFSGTFYLPTKLNFDNYR